MQIKGLAVLGLAAVAGLAGCRGGANTNTAVVNTNTTVSNVNIAMATPASTPMAMPDTATQTAVDSAIKKAGIDGVTVAATSSEVTLRGSVAKGKMSEAVRIATETGRKKVNNQLTEK